MTICADEKCIKVWGREVNNDFKFCLLVGWTITNFGALFACYLFFLYMGAV